MIIKDCKHLIELQHIHYEQMILKYVKVKCYVFKYTSCLQCINDKILVILLVKIKLKTIKTGHIFQTIHTEY